MVPASPPVGVAPPVAVHHPVEAAEVIGVLRGPELAALATSDAVASMSHEAEAEGTHHVERAHQPGLALPV